MTASGSLLSVLVSIAFNTFREAIRNKVLHGIIVMAFGLVVGSLLLGELSVENDARVIRDMGFTFLNLVLVIVAIFSGINLLYLEIQRKTIYTIVTKPVTRWTFILGKYLGLLLTLLVVEALVAVVLLGLIVLRGDPFSPVFLQVLVLVFWEGALVAAIATFFSSFSSPFLSAMFTVGIFLLGRLREQIYQYADLIQVSVLPDIMRVLGAGVPDLTLHRADLQVAYLVPLYWDYVLYTASYTLAYIGVVVTLACLIFSRRDFV